MSILCWKFKTLACNFFSEMRAKKCHEWKWWREWKFRGIQYNNKQPINTYLRHGFLYRGMWHSALNYSDKFRPSRSQRMWIVSLSHSEYFATIIENFLHANSVLCHNLDPAYPPYHEGMFLCTNDYLQIYTCYIIVTSSDGATIVWYITNL